MTRIDFDGIIVPCLAKFSWIPSPMEKDWTGVPIGDAYWQLSSSDYHTQVIGRERVLGKCDDRAVSAVIRMLRMNYELLNTAVLRSMPQVKLLATQRECPLCGKLDGTVVEVTELIAEYATGNPRFPHTLSSLQDPDWCVGPRFLDTLQFEQGDDADFHAWLVKTLSE